MNNPTVAERITSLKARIENLQAQLFRLEEAEIELDAKRDRAIGILVAEMRRKDDEARERTVREFLANLKAA